MVLLTQLHAPFGFGAARRPGSAQRRWGGRIPLQAAWRPRGALGAFSGPAGCIFQDSG